MDQFHWWQPVLGALATVVVAYLAYLGARATAAGAKAGVDRTSDVAAQESALSAWQELLEPYRAEVRGLRASLQEERDQRAARDRVAEERRLERERAVQSQMDKLSERIEVLTIELGHWKRLAKVIARWATTLRDQVLTLGGQVPATPDELLLIQSIDTDDDPPPTAAHRKS